MDCHIESHIHNDIVSSRSEKDSISGIGKLTMVWWILTRVLIMNDIEDVLSIWLARSKDLDSVSVPIWWIGFGGKSHIQ